MRTLKNLVLASALAFSSLVIAPEIADACGGYVQWQPTVFAVSTHSTGDFTRDSFVVFEERLPDADKKKVKFTRLDKMSFDTTSVSASTKLPKPMTFTLLGPSGAKVIEAKQKLWVDVAFERAAPRSGVRIAERGEFTIAIAGSFADATWENFDVMNGSTVTVFTHGDLQISTGHGSNQTMTNAGVALDGYPLGLATIRGVRYVVMQNNHAVRIVEI